MVTSAAPVTKTKTVFLLGSRRRSRCSPQWTELSHEKAQNSQNVPKRRERPRSDSRRERDLLNQGRKWGCGEGPGGKNLPCEQTPPLPSGAVLSMIWNVLAEKQKLKIDFNFQFSIFRLPSKTEKLSHATDCNIVGETKQPLSFILFKFDRIKVKI